MRVIQRVSRRWLISISPCFTDDEYLVILSAGSSLLPPLSIRLFLLRLHSPYLLISSDTWQRVWMEVPGETVYIH